MWTVKVAFSYRIHAQPSHLQTSACEKITVCLLQSNSYYGVLVKTLDSPFLLGANEFSLTYQLHLFLFLESSEICNCS